MGKFIFYYSVVGARKSAELILTAHRNTMAGKKVAVFQPETNTRDGGQIKSRALKESFDATMLTKNFNIYDWWLENRPNLILIDEVQFITKEHVRQLAKIIKDSKTLVFAYGLLSNFKGELFETISFMLPFVTKIVEIPTVCEMCGDAKATMNLLIDESQNKDGGEIIIGNHFKGVCLKCFFDYNQKNKTTPRN